MAEALSDDLVKGLTQQYIAKEPIGMLKGDRLLLNEAGICHVAEVWAGGDVQLYCKKLCVGSGAKQQDNFL